MIQKIKEMSSLLDLWELNQSVLIVQERILVLSRSDRGLIGRIVQIVTHKGMSTTGHSAT
jgi:hypothetical protein